MMRVGLGLSVLLLSAPTASADYYPELPPKKPPSLAPPSSVTPLPQPAYVMVDPEQGPRSPGLAVTLSLMATIVPPLVATAVWNDSNRGGVGEEHDEDMLWVVGASLLLGPSVGHWYSGKVLTPGLGVRALGYALIAAGVDDDSDDGFGLVMLGITAVIGGASYDVATAGRSARQYNFEHATRILPVIAPVITPEGTQLRLGITGNF